MRTKITEIAWAAGFFDGEGSCLISSPRTAYMSVRQTHPEVLHRFQQAVGFGSIRGPYQQKNKKHSPYWEWGVGGHTYVQAAVAILWGFLGTVKREQALRVLTNCYKEPPHWVKHANKEHVVVCNLKTRKTACYTCQAIPKGGHV